MCYCPKCESPTSIVSSINTIIGNGIKNLRKCTNKECNNSFNTIELPYDKKMNPIIIPLLETTTPSKAK